MARRLSDKPRLSVTRLRGEILGTYAVLQDGVVATNTLRFDYGEDEMAIDVDEDGEAIAVQVLFGFGQKNLVASDAGTTEGLRGAGNGLDDTGGNDDE